MQPACNAIAEYARAAQATLPSAIWDYLDSGSGEGRTRLGNVAAFDSMLLMPRPLADVRGGHTRTELFGRALAHPFLLAPVAYQRLFHPQGEIGSAMAAQAQQATMIVSSLASQPLVDIAATGADLWFQLYWQAGRDATLRLLRKAEAAGAKAIVFTVDAPVKQATLALPDGIRAVNLECGPVVPAISPGQSVVFDRWMAIAPNWDDLAWLRTQTRLPLLVKGILHEEDARRALAVGCDGLIISNHGGRVLDGTPSALSSLRRLRKTLPASVPLLFDSGIRSGDHAFKALALGASAVLVGRPAIWGLTAAGPLGVAHVLRLMRDELEMTMALTGHATIDRLHAGCEPFANEE